MNYPKFIVASVSLANQVFPDEYGASALGDCEYGASARASMIASMYEPVL